MDRLWWQRKFFLCHLFICPKYDIINTIGIRKLSKVRKERLSMKKVKSSKLARVTIMRVVLLSWVLVTGICLLAAQAIKRENLRVYEAFAKSYSRIIAENVNGDMARKYLETEVHETMQAMVDNADLRYLYVYVPEEAGIRYIWDAQSDDDSRPLNDIWYYEGDYPKDDIKKTYTDGEELFRTYKYGDMSLAAYIVPMYDSSKNIVALVEADIIMPRSEMLLPGVLLNIVVIVLIVMAIAMALFYYFTRKRIISPLEKINDATKEIVENIDNDKEMVIDVSTNDEIEMAGALVQVPIALHVAEHCRIHLQKVLKLIDNQSERMSFRNLKHKSEDFRKRGQLANDRHAQFVLYFVNKVTAQQGFRLFPDEKIQHFLVTTFQ